MYNKKLLSYLLLFTVLLSALAPVQTGYAASVDQVLGAMTSPTAPDSGGGGIFGSLFSFLFEKILGPILNIFDRGGGSSGGGKSPGKLPPSDSGSIVDPGVLRGKVIVVDPGHGGTNPGAVSNGTREADNNLAVGLKLRDKLQRAGAKVIMTRTADRNVAAAGSSLGEELAARVDMAERNNADIFVSIHSNSNPDSRIAGAMTFYPSGKSSKLAIEVQNELIKEIRAVDKGIEPATFYVLRNITMPGILVEMGFVTNAAEAALLADDGYRNKIASGIFTGIAKYFQK